MIERKDHAHCKLRSLQQRLGVFKKHKPNTLCSNLTANKRYDETYQLDWIGQSLVGLCVSVH